MTATPRRKAFDILLRIEKERSYADILIDQVLAKGELKGPDRGLLTELVYGVLRRRATLDHIIGQFSTQKIEKLEQAVLILLRLGLYQAFFLDRVPISAAVNETVNLAKILAPRASGFINAVLRSADRGRKSIAYPDREQAPAAFLSAFYSHPAWIAQKWIEQLGITEAEALAEAMSRPAPLTIRINTLKTSGKELLTMLAGEQATARTAQYSPDALHITTHTSIPSLKSFREGLFTVQDESSQLASIFLSPEPGERVLDICAAPGGKTTHMAQLMGNRGEITACDVKGRKLRLIEESARRLGITIIQTMEIDAVKSLERIGESRFNRILVDAPCSGLGVIRRNPEGKWWKSPEDTARLAAAQGSILRNAADRLADGGALLYAVCSTDRDENEAIVDDFLSERADFVLEDLGALFPQFAELITEKGCFRSWPHRHGMDGFFAARLRKING